MEKYFFEAINSRAPRSSGHISAANRFKINSVTTKNNGTHDLQVEFKGRNTTIKVDPKRPSKDMMFRNEAGTPVDFKVVVGAFIPPE